MSWADDFSLQNSTANQLGKPVVKKSPTRKEQLEAELKLLEWHKLANDAAIKVGGRIKSSSRTFVHLTLVPCYIID